jgi:hypothetical protein
MFGAGPQDLRQTFTQAADVLTAVCPCWMASPLSVCQLITATGIFDYVIFDEASQVLPEDAVPAILRGRHIIVAGDNKQLPPSAFFAAADGYELTLARIAGESLPRMSAMRITAPQEWKQVAKSSPTTKGSSRRKYS